MHPLIWRAAHIDFYDDEPLNAPDVYTAERFGKIRAHGFDAVWLRGRLRELTDSPVIPDLTDPQQAHRIENLRTVIRRGRREGVGVYLFFNEPLAPFKTDPFWQSHPELQGEPWTHPVKPDRNAFSLCTSIQPVKDYMRGATADLFKNLPDLAGVILITASEYHTHCWSHTSRLVLSDGYRKEGEGKPTCPRCAEREPADVVAELVGFWRDAAGGASGGRVMVWNWSWSMWYPEPQREVINALPDGVELMCDFERGGHRDWFDRSILVDEYSLGYIGPSERFTKSRVCVDTVHAKLQIGTTHEIATVPNLPLIGNLHAKLCGLQEQNVSGAMCTWNFGTLLTLNTFAFGRFQPDRDLFFHDVATGYFGDCDVETISAAWLGFADAFAAYPFDMALIYRAPINMAPAYPLSLEYRDHRMGPAWLVHEPWGDRLDDCLGCFTLDEVIRGFEAVTRTWREHLPRYIMALAPGPGGEYDQHRREERNTAVMIGHQLTSVLHLFRFHQWRGRGKDTLDDVGRTIVEAELANVEAALPLVESDPRLGLHLECQAYLYDAPRMRTKIDALRNLRV